MDSITIFLALLEGFALIISPCILPILPIVLSASLTGNSSRPLGIIMGFVLTFTLVTLFSRGLFSLLHINADTVRYFSFAILFLLGIMMTSTWLTEKFARLTQSWAEVGRTSKMANDNESGIVGGLIMGGLIGVIWTPCAGPILATVIVQVILQKTTLSSIAIVLAFAFGASIPMFLIAIAGRRIMHHFQFFREHAEFFRKLLGMIILAAVFYLIYDSGVSFSKATPSKESSTFSLINPLEHPYQAPEISGIDAWINSSPLELSALKGKVVLIDFWTYSCINCLRTLPYLKKWYQDYHSKGLEIIGIHSPEFEFEHKLDNVKNAVVKQGIRYPVALDNRFATWQAFKNEYWPAHYLINQEGKVVYQHFGEGEYDTTENNIRYLLGMKTSIAPDAYGENYSLTQTPETYLGYTRAERFSSSEAIVKDKVSDYHYPAVLLDHQWALQGKWIVYPDKIVAASAGASIKLRCYAAKVYAVMGTSGKAVKVSMVLGNDKTTRRLIVKRNQLYTLITKNAPQRGSLELTALAPGFEMYTFTFGN